MYELNEVELASVVGGSKTEIETIKSHEVVSIIAPTTVKLNDNYIKGDYNGSYNGAVITVKQY